MKTMIGSVALLAAVALAGCGTQDAPRASESGTPTASAVATPSTPTATARGGNHDVAMHLVACDRVWREGRPLPVHYRACRNAAGDAVRAQSRPCSIGNRLVQYHRFYAVPGHQIHRARPSKLKDRAYQQVLAACTG